MVTDVCIALSIICKRPDLRTRFTDYLNILRRNVNGKLCVPMLNNLYPELCLSEFTVHKYGTIKGR